MKKEEYIKTLYNPDIWFQKAIEQKKVADCLVEKCMLDKAKNKKEIKENIFSFWTNALYHYGIGIENGLKGLIIKYKPETIKIKIEEGNVHLIKIGGRANKSHNLVKIAIDAGVFDESNNIFKNVSNYDFLESALLQLTETLKWGAKYPISNNTKRIDFLKGKTPSVIAFGFYILDVLDPLFEVFEKEINIEKNPIN